MNRRKFLRISGLCLLLVFCFGWAAARTLGSGTTVETTVDVEARSVAVTVSSEELAGESVSVICYAPGWESGDVTAVEDNLDLIAAVGQLTLNEEGTASAVYPLRNGLEDGTYTLVIGSGNMDKPVIKEFELRKDAEEPTTEEPTTEEPTTEEPTTEEPTMEEPTTEEPTTEELTTEEPTTEEPTTEEPTTEEPTTEEPTTEEPTTAVPKETTTAVPKETTAAPTTEAAHTHSYDKGTVTTKPTCTTEGVRTYTCTVCGEKKTEEIAVIPHETETKTTKATLKADGKIDQVCTMCGEVVSGTLISRPDEIGLSADSYTYNGKKRKPKVSVIDRDGKKIAASNYTVTYSSGCKKVGSYTVTVKFKGNYSGTKKLTFKINPKGTSISKLTAGKKRLTVKWKKQTKQTTGYQIQYSLKKNFKSAKSVTVSKNKTTRRVIKRLKAKKKYYVRIRTYKIVKVKGKKVKFYSDWSKVKSAKTKK